MRWWLTMFARSFSSHLEARSMASRSICRLTRTILPILWFRMGSQSWLLKYLNLFERMHGIKAITLRVANPYGERQRIETAQGVVGVFIHHALKGLPIEIWGDGSVTRDYIYVSDVAEAFVRAVEYS